MIDTASVCDVRRLRYASIDDLIKDVDRICAADSAGTMRRTGNWSAGQAFGHLASWINFAYDGYPMRAPPWFIRMLIRRKMLGYLANGMPRGVRIPGAPLGTYAVDPLTTAEGARRLRAAWTRLKNGEAAKFDSPALGRLTDEHRIALNLRHAELHLGYMHPEASVEKVAARPGAPGWP